MKTKIFFLPVCSATFFLTLASPLLAIPMLKERTPTPSEAATRQNFTEQARKKTAPLTTDQEDVEVATENACNESQQTLDSMEISRERSSSDRGQVKPAVNLGKPPAVTGKFSRGTTVVQTSPNSSTKDAIIGGIKFPGLPEGPVLPSVPTHPVGQPQQGFQKHAISDATHTPFADFNLADLPDIVPWQSLDNKSAKTEQPAVKAASSLTQQQASSAAAVIKEPELPPQQSQRPLGSLNILRPESPKFAAKLYPDVPAIKYDSIETTGKASDAAATVTAEKVNQHQFPMVSAPPAPPPLILNQGVASTEQHDDYSKIPVVEAYPVTDEEPASLDDAAVAQLWQDVEDDAAQEKEKAYLNQAAAAGETKDISGAKSAYTRAAEAAANLEKTKAATAETKRQKEIATFQKEVDVLYQKTAESFLSATTATEAHQDDVAQLYTGAGNYYTRAAAAKEQRKDVLSDFLRDAGNVSFYAAEHISKRETFEDKNLYEEISIRLRNAIYSYDLADKAKNAFGKNCFYNAGEAYFCAAQLQNLEKNNPAIGYYRIAGDIYKQLFVDYTTGGKFRNEVKVHLSLPLSYKNAADATNRGDESAANLFLRAAGYYDKRRYESGSWITEKLGTIGDCYFEQAMLPKNSAAYEQLENAHDAFETRKSKNKTPWDSGEKAYKKGVLLKSPEEKAQYSNAIKAANRFEQEQEESFCTFM